MSDEDASDGASPKKAFDPSKDIDRTTLLAGTQVGTMLGGAKRQAGMTKRQLKRAMTKQTLTDLSP